MESEVVEYIKRQGYMPVRIQPVCDAKHIFSHVEWHMKGYVVFLQALGFSKNQEDVEPLEENVKNYYVILPGDVIYID